MVRVYRKKRNYARKRKTLSKGNVYRNRNSYSQARQIVALNRKINQISKLNRPEIRQKLFQASKTFNQLDSNSTQADTYLGFQIQPNTDTYFNYNAGSYSGSIMPAIDGQWLQIWGGSLKFTVQYNNQISVGDVARPFSANVRVLILMRKAAYNISVGNTAPSGYIENYSVANQNLLHLYPLRDGITAECKVLYDKFFKIGSATTIEKSFKWKIPKLRYEKMDGTNYPKYVVFGYIIVNGLDNFGPGDHVSLDSILKVNYSDNI